MCTGSEARGDAQVDNETPLEFSDDWSDGHFELSEQVSG